LTRETERPSTGEIETPCHGKLLAWLREAASPEVRYPIARDFDHPSHEELSQLWERVTKGKVAARLLARQEASGGWHSGILDSAYSPKYITTVWRLIKLGRLGFDTRDSRIERAAEFSLRYQTESGGFVRFHSYARPGQFDPCDTATHLLALGSVGLGADPRVEKTAAGLIARQREDGGWIRSACRKKRGSSASCATLTSTAARALDLLHEGSSESTYVPAVKKALGFLLSHLQGLTAPERKRFLGRGHLLVAELLLFAKTGFPRWPAMQLDRPLGVGASGGHGPIRYRVEVYEPSRQVTFRFTAPQGFDGTHTFEVEPVGTDQTRLRHKVEMRLRGPPGYLPRPSPPRRRPGARVPR